MAQTVDLSDTHLVRNERIPTTREALGLIGGAMKLAKLRSHTVRLATATVPTKLQLAVAIGRRHFGMFSQEDLATPMRADFGRPFQLEQMAYILNREYGPWAVGLSGNALTWKPVTITDLAALHTSGDFLELVFHHLR